MESLRETICKNFNRILEEHPHIKNKQIAEAAQVHPSMIYKWRDGVNIPEPEKMEAIAQLFRVDVMEFYKTGSNMITIQPSRALKKYLVIPDEVVELASQIGPDQDYVWEEILETLHIAIKQKEVPSR